MSLVSQINSVLTYIGGELQTIAGRAYSAYQKPQGGIPKADMASTVQTSLGKADSAVQPAGLTKAAVGLPNVDNTSDANKPVSTAMQAALDGKVAPAQLVPFRQSANAVDAWAADKVVSQAYSRVAYEDAVSSNETWNGLNNWRYNTGKLQVSGGRMYSGDAATGTAYGAVNITDIGNYARTVLKTTINIPAAGTDTGDIIIGFTNELNVVPTAAGRAAKGVTFGASAADGSLIQLWDLGTRTTLGTYAPGTYYVTLTLDPANSIGVTVTQANSTYSLNGVIPLNGMVVKSRYIFNNDTRVLNGKSMGQMGTTIGSGYSTHRSRAGIEDLSPFWAFLTDTGTYQLHIAVPKSYDSRKPAPVVMAFHGAGTAAYNYGSGNNNNSAMMSAFTSAGFIVVSASLKSNLTTWGADAGLAVYEYAYQFVKSFFSIGQVVFYGNSMGGIESLLTLARNKIPCSAWMATVPTVSLRNNYDDNYASQIGPSYGIASDGSDFATKTAGHDPLTLDPGSFRGLPMMVVIATDDVRVYPDRNWNLLEPKIVPVIPDYNRVNVTGGHTSASLSSVVPQMLAFAQKYVQVPIT